MCDGRRCRSLRLRCSQVDGGWLREVSRSDAPVECTRAGGSIVVDYILVGSIGSNAPLKYTANPQSFVPVDDFERASDATEGVRFAISKWGSDHLPVIADLAH